MRLMSRSATVMMIRVVLSTEWECVTIMSDVDGYFPSASAETDPAIEEERRVFYVALSRGKERLEILMLCGRSLENTKVSLKATPFLATALLPMCSQ